MKTLNPCELRDLDGSYALVRPLDDVRCRVIDSNVFAKGELLCLWNTPYDWIEGSEDLGGCTRIGLADLIPRNGPIVEDRGEDILPLERAFGEHADSEAEEHRMELEAVAPDEDVPDEDDFDFDATLRRLTLHFVEVHLHLADGVPTMEDCRCPGIAPANEWAQDRLYAVIWITFALGRFLSIPQMIMAMGEIGMTPRLMD